MKTIEKLICISICCLLSLCSFSQNTCQDAIEITSIPFDSGLQSTCGTGDDYTGVGCLQAIDGEDFVFKLEVTNAPITHVVTLNGEIFTRVHIYNGCPDGGGECIQDAIQVGAIPGIGTVTFTENGTFYFIVHRWGLFPCDNFILELGAEVSNDDCVDAIPFPLVPTDGSCVTIESTTIGATPSVPSACLGTENNDVWFSFVATSDAVVILIDSLFVFSDLIHEVFSGTCGNLQSLTCTIADSSLTNGLTIGETYYIRTHTSSETIFTDFDICLKAAPSPPPNDFCIDAIEINCGEIIMGNNSYATNDFNPNCDGQVSDKDVWYQFEGNGDTILLSTCNSDFYTNLVVYTGSCSDLTCLTGNDLICNPEVGSYFEFVSIPNTIYYILVEGYNNTFFGNFQLEVECREVLGNDLAITQLISPMDSCAYQNLQEVQVEISNVGFIAQSNFQVSYIINGTTFTSTFSGTIEPNAVANFTFPQTVNLSNIGEYDFQVFTNLSNDQNNLNDTLTTTVEHLPPLEINILSSGINNSICQGDNIYIQADYNVNYQYQWSSGDFGYIISDNPTQTTTYSVTVTDLTQPSCVGVGEITIEVLPIPTVATFFQSSNFLCFPNGTMTLTVPGISDSLTWNTGETGSSITINQSGYYQVTHTNDNGCQTFYGATIFYDNVPFISNDVILCNQTAANLSVFAVNGSTYLWSNGDTTATISVIPMETTIYSVTVTTPNNCVHILEATVVVASDAPPGVVTNLLPTDGVQNLAFPINFSWSPGDNASYYQVFIWEEGNTPTTIPYFTTTQISETLNNNNSGIQFGNTYNWKVCTINSCGTIDSVCSVVQQFTLNFLPDLIVEADSIAFPETVFSGTSVQLEWDVLNQGIGSTQGVSNNGQWYDVAYLSADMTLGFGDIFLGSKERPNALLPNDNYNNTLTFNINNGVEGEFYIIVCTDRYSDMPESDENNNCSVAAIPITVELSPFPDLVITACPPIGSAEVILADSTYSLQWTVENQANGINAGATLSGTWYDRIYISKQNNCNANPNNFTLLKTVEHEGNLEVGETYTAFTDITIPGFLEDTVYLFIRTDVYDDEYEFDFENNNCKVSVPHTIPIIPKPDFEIIGSVVPDTASNRENITISWTGINNAASFTGSFSDRVYINSSLNFFGAQTLGSSVQNFSTTPLNTQEGYDGEGIFQIPSHLNGKYYLFIRANGYNGIDETDFSNNIYLDSIFIISPDLTVNNIEPVPDAFSGQTIPINWEIENIGPGDLLSAYVNDRVRIIDIDNPNNTFFLGSANDNLTLFPNNNVARQINYNIPNGFTGKFCVEVVTNYNQHIFENNLYANNTFLQCDTFEILPADYPNLVAESVASIPTSATAGDNIEVVFRVNNEGNAATSNNWSDRIYLSDSCDLNFGNSIQLKTIPHSQIISMGDFYEKTVSVFLPYYLQTGDYYFHLVTDVGNNIFETDETDNIVCSSNALQIQVYPEVDLQFVGIPSGPATLTPGQSGTISFQVKNEGTVATPTATWKDALYLLPDATWQPSDFLIKEWQHNGALNADGIYSRQETFILPAGFTDAFYLCLVIDHENAVNENNESNNYVKILQQNGDTITITYPPQPDLTVANCSIPSNVNAGQPIWINYNIQNLSSTGNAEGTWKESFYLSTDQVVNGGDIFLGQKNHTGGLLTNEGYADSLEVTIPLGAAGNYFLLTRTDAGNNISETNETNNVKSEYVFINQPTPSDLVVLMDEIFVPPLDTIATDITISWTTKNIGQHPMSGYMQEGVYLSNDTIWDASDIFLGTWEGTIGLDANASVEHELTARLENVKRQNYHVFVKTDLLDHFLENDESNNCSIGTNPVFVEVPELPIGLPSTPVELALEKPIYYRIEIPIDTIGETMRVSITSTDGSAFNELYVRLNDIPSRTVHDYTFNAPFSPNQEIIIPAVSGGTYYVMAYAVDGAAMQNVEMLAEIIPFQITSIEANQGGNTGQVTAILQGAKFEIGMTVELAKAGFPTIIATQVSVVNSSKAFVTFPLEGAAIGFYDVVAAVPSDQDTLENGFEIITGSIGNTPLQASCTFSFSPQNIVVTNVPTNVEVLELQTTHLPSARPNQVVPITIRIENTGDVDIPIPTRIFDSLNGFPLARTVANLSPGFEYLSLSFGEINGPPDVLRPGGVATIKVFTKVDLDKDEMKFKLNLD